MVQLSAWSTTQEAFIFVYRNRRIWFNLALPLIVITALIGSLFRLYAAGEHGEDNTMLSLVNFILIVVQTIIYTSFAVAWHRFFLDTRNDSTVLEQLLWDKDKTRYLIFSIQLMLIATLAFLPIGLLFGLGRDIVQGQGIGQFIFLAALFSLVIYIIAMITRLSLIYPSLAIDKKLSMRQAWDMTKPYVLYVFSANLVPIVLTLFLTFIAWLILGAILSLFIAEGGIEYIFDHIIGVRKSPTIVFLLSIFETFFSFLLFAVITSALSRIYTNIMNASGAK